MRSPTITPPTVARSPCVEAKEEKRQQPKIAVAAV
jgi:hypothetical protein